MKSLSSLGFKVELFMKELTLELIILWAMLSEHATILKFLENQMKSSNSPVPDVAEAGQRPSSSNAFQMLMNNEDWLLYIQIPSVIFDCDAKYGRFSYYHNVLQILRGWKTPINELTLFLNRSCHNTKKFVSFPTKKSEKQPSMNWHLFYTFS